MKNYRVVFREIDRDKFNEIAKGLKTIETRAATVRYQPVKAGDRFTFVCGKDKFSKTISKVQHFNSLDELLSKLPLEKILPSAKNVAEARKVFCGFTNYKTKIEKHGVLAFTLK